MSDTNHQTSRLRLPLIAEAQAQKHVTHNNALALLDRFTHLCVKSANVTAPPTAPQSYPYIIGRAPTGAFQQYASNIAIYDENIWRFYPPSTGMRAYSIDERKSYIYTGQIWEDTASNLAMLGIQTAASENNRLAVKSGGVLFSAPDSGTNSGNIRHYINKSSADKFATTVYQNNWSGRAEIGLANDDDFSIKVSSNGQNFQTALKVKSSDGKVECHSKKFQMLKSRLGHRLTFELIDYNRSMELNNIFAVNPNLPRTKRVIAYFVNISNPGPALMEYSVVAGYVPSNISHSNRLAALLRSSDKIISGNVLNEDERWLHHYYPTPVALQNVVFVAGPVIDLARLSPSFRVNLPSGAPSYRFHSQGSFSCSLTLWVLNLPGAS